MSELMKDVVAYVEVRSSSDNRSAAVCRELQQLGARVESSFTDDVTHVVFKEGMRRTYNKALKKAIPLVSVTWLESCKTNQRLMPEKDYAALIPEETNSPLVRLNPNRRWRKMKSMQPYEYEEEVARSAERSVKRRRRVEEANRFKLLEDSTPTSSSPSSVLVPDTQGRSPFFSDLSRSHSPSLAVVADTPITPTIKDRIEKMRKEENALGSGEQSPKGTGRHKAILQKRLFEKLAKDIFSTEDSDDEDDDTTARVVAKLIDGLESQEEETASPRKKIKTMSSCEKTPEQLSKNRQSPRQSKLKIPNEDTSQSQDLFVQSSPKRLSSRISQQSSETILDKKEEVEYKNGVTKSNAPKISAGRNSDNNGASASFPNISNHKSDTNESSNAISNKRKKFLLSEPGSCSTLFGSEQNCSETKGKLSKKKEKEELSQEVSFLFGHNNKVNKAVNRRRSARLNTNNNCSLTSDSDGMSVKDKRIIHLKTSKRQNSTEAPLADCSKGLPKCASTDQLANNSMSVIYDQSLALPNESPHKPPSRRSLDEFLPVKRGKKSDSVQKSSRRASNLGCRNKESDNSESSQAVKGRPGNKRKSQQLLQSMEHSTLNGKKNPSLSDSYSSRLSSTSEDEAVPRKLRHANSLLMEISLKPLAKQSHLSLVMTSLHRHEQETVLSIVKKLGVFKVTDNVDDKTTHIVCGEPRRTLNLLRAIAKGCWVLNKDWVFQSLEAGQWLVEENFEMEEEFPAAKKTRCDRMATRQPFQVGLFSHCGPMFVAKSCIPPRKDLVDLLSLCSGSVTNSQQRADVFIDSEYSENRVNIKPSWILDSIMKMEVFNKEDYIVEPPALVKRENSPEF